MGTVEVIEEREGEEKKDHRAIERYKNILPGVPGSELFRLSFIKYYRKDVGETY